MKKITKEEFEETLTAMLSIAFREGHSLKRKLYHGESKEKTKHMVETLIRFFREVK